MWEPFHVRAVCVRPGQPTAPRLAATVAWREGRGMAAGQAHTRAEKLRVGTQTLLLCALAGVRAHFLRLTRMPCRTLQHARPHPTAPLAADKAAAGAGGSADAFSLTDLSDQLRRLGSKIQSATSAGAQRGLEFTTSLTRGAAAGASASAASAEASAAATAAAGGAGGGSAPAAGAAGLADAAAGGGPVSSLLEEDPDLEAYLQVGCPAGQGGPGVAACSGRKRWGPHPACCFPPQNCWRARQGTCGCRPAVALCMQRRLGHSAREQTHPLPPPAAAGLPARPRDTPLRHHPGHRPDPAPPAPPPSRTPRWQSTRLAAAAAATMRAAAALTRWATKTWIWTRTSTSCQLRWRRQRQGRMAATARPSRRRQQRETARRR